MKKTLKFIFIKLPLAFLLLTVLWVLVLKWVPVWITPLMISRSIEYRNDATFKTVKTWKSYGNISPSLAMAVIASEDNRFAQHDGFDWTEMRKAIDEHQRKGKRLRGASTISQQTAKNVFLLPTHSFIRKGFEAYFTVLIELLWGKERIMEVYLNIAEMGNIWSRSCRTAILPQRRVKTDKKGICTDCSMPSQPADKTSGQAIPISRKKGGPDTDADTQNRISGLD